MSETLLIAQQSSGGLMDFLVHANEQTLLVLLSLGLILGAMVLVVAIVATANTVSAIAKRQIDTTLKHDMLDRGMTVEDAIAMIRATPNSRGLSR